MAGKIPVGNIVADIDLNNTGVVRSLREMRQAVTSATSAWKAQSAELKSAGRTTEAAVAKYKGLSETVEKQKSYVENLQRELKRYSDIQRTADTSTKEGKKSFDNATEALKKTQDQLNRATTRLSSLSKQQERAKKSADYYKSGLAEIQKNLKLSAAVSKSYVARLQSEGKNYQANKEKINNYRNSVSELTKQLSIQKTELSKIASASGATSEAYKRQQIRVNETTSSINKAKASINSLESANKKINPTPFQRLKDKLTGVNKEATHTHRTFKQVFMGSALGTGLTNAISNAGSQLKSIYKDGMAFNEALEKINDRFKSMGMNGKQVKQLDAQIKDLKYNTSMGANDVAQLQTKMMNWSTIGQKGAMQMTKMIAGVGDSSKLSGNQVAQLGNSLMRVGATGKVSFSALNRVAKSAPTFYSQLAKGAGMSESKLKDLLRSGKVTQKQFQGWMAAASKYSDSAFKEYGKTQEASMKRIKDGWASLKGTMMKPLFEAKNSGMQELAKLLTSKELTQGAQAIGEGINKIVEGLYKHRKDITGIAKDVFSIAIELGKSLWKDFAGIITDIGKSFGLIHGNSKKSGDALHTVKLALDGLAKNKTAIQWISKAIIAMAAAKEIGKLGGGLFGIAQGGYKAYKNIKLLKAGFTGLKDFHDLTGTERKFAHFGSIVKSTFTHLQNGWDKTLIHLSNGKTKIANAFSAFKDGTSKALKAIKGFSSKIGSALTSGMKKLGSKLFDMGKTLGQKISAGYSKSVDFGKGLFGKGTGAGKLNGLLQSAHSAGGFKNLSTAGKVGTAAAGVGVAVDSATSIVKGIKDKLGSRKQFEDIGSGAGSAIGGGIGLFFGGPAGAAIGSQIGKVVGKWAGDSAKNFQKGWNAKKPPKKFWSLENMGYSAHNMWNGFTKGVSKTIDWFKKNWKEIGLYLINPIAGAFNSLYKHNKGFRKWVDGLVKGFKKAWKGMVKWFSKLGRNMAKGLKSAWKGMTKWFSNIGKGIKKAWKAMTSWFSKLGHNMAKGLKSAWHGMTSFFSKIGSGIKSAWHGMTNWFGKLGSGMAKGLKSAWNGVTGFFSKIGSGIKNVFSGVANFFGKTLKPIIDSVKGFGSNVGKFFTGKLKVGNLHLANGTDWKRKYPVLATLNDGHDSPETGNREGILHKNGAIELVNGVNVRRWLLPDDEVINAHDMAAMFGSTLHLAGGTVKVAKNHGFLELLNVATQILQKMGGTSVKSSSKSNPISVRSKTGVNSITKATDKAVKDLKTKGNFKKPLEKMVKKSDKNISDFTKKYPKRFEKANKKSSENLKKFTKNYQDTWKKHWKATDRTYDRWIKNTHKEQNGFNSKFERGFKNLSNGTGKIYSHFWSNMHKTAGKGLNNVISVLNSGISRIDSVISQFGGSGSAVHHVSGVHYATGTGYFRRAITKPTFAIVNDGNDSPETGNREALYRPQTGEVSVFQGRNVPTMLMPGDEIFNATETKMLGLTAPKHFATGTGALKHLYELAKSYWKKPTQTGSAMFGAVNGLTGAINSLAQGMRRTGKNQGVKWWSQLWSMVDKKVNDGLGPASGLLKAVEKYGEGHRYVWGAAGPDTFDCSGLVMYALKKAYGISYPHFSGAQYGMTSHISKSQARMGDLVFWGDGGGEHVGVYAGGNRYFSAQSPSQGIHMNTLSSVVGYGAPKFGRVRGINAQGTKDVKVKANTALEKQIRAVVGKGFWSTIQKIKDKYGEAEGGPNAKPTGDHGHWLKQAGIPTSEYPYYNYIINHESSWNPHATNPSSGAYGIPQALPGNKMASAGSDWRSNAITQLKWMKGYVKSTYGGIRNAYRFWLSHHAYANGGLASKPSIFGEAGPEMAIPLIPSKSTRAWELIGKTVGILTKNKSIGSVNEEEIKKERKEDKQFKKDVLNALNLIANLLADQTIKTNVDLDGRKVGEAVSKFINRQNRHSIIAQQRGYANGI